MLSNQRHVPLWWFDWLLPAIAVSGLFYKITVIEQAILPSEIFARRAADWSLIAAIALLSLLLSRTRGLSRFWWAWTANAAGTAIGLADLWHFRFYGDLLTAADVRSAVQIPVVAASVEALAQPLDWWLLADLFALALLTLLTWQRAPAPDHRPSRRLAVAAAATLLVASVNTAWTIWEDPDWVINAQFTRTEVVGAIGLTGYHAFDLARTAIDPVIGRIEARGSSPAIAARLDELSRDRMTSPLAGAARGLNVLLVSAESLQSFALDLTYNGQPVAPTLRTFAHEALNFTSIYDQAAGGTTADGEYLALNSLLPLDLAVVATRYAGNDFDALPKLLGQHGYSTFSACGEPPSFWNMWKIHGRYGFERSQFLNSMKLTEWIGAGLDDAAFFRQVVPRLNAGASPFFGFLLTSSHHHPYRLPDPLQQLKPGPWPDTMAGDYMQSLRHFDDAFRVLLDDLKQRNLLDTTAIVVYGDHTSHLPEDDLRRIWQTLDHEHPPTPLELWQLKKGLSLMIRLPHGQFAGRRDVPGGQIDIAPTILSLLGIEAAPQSWLGRDLTAPARRVVSFTNGSFSNLDVTSIVNDAGDQECYARNGSRIACDGVAHLQAIADEQVSISRQIVTGNLIADLRARVPASTTPAPLPLPPFIAIGHRGDSTNFPENTMSAINAALDAGVDAVEVDIHLTRDGVLMVMHDDELERTTNGRGEFAALAASEVKKLDAGSWMSARFKNERVPTLEEALRAATRSGAKLFLDLKVDGVAKPAAALYTRLGIPHDLAWAGIRSEEQRLEFLRDMPGARRIWVTDAPDRWTAAYFQDVRDRGFWAIELGERWPPAFVADAVRAGIPVFGYTVNDELRMRRLRELGVSGMESDNPTLLLRTLRGR